MNLLVAECRRREEAVVVVHKHLLAADLLRLLKLNLVGLSSKPL